MVQTFVKNGHAVETDQRSQEMGLETHPSFRTLPRFHRSYIKIVLMMWWFDSSSNPDFETGRLAGTHLRVEINFGISLSAQ